MTFHAILVISDLESQCKVEYVGMIKFINLFMYNKYIFLILYFIDIHDASCDVLYNGV